MATLEELTRQHLGIPDCQIAISDAELTIDMPPLYENAAVLIFQGYADFMPFYYALEQRKVLARTPLNMKRLVLFSFTTWPKDVAPPEVDFTLTTGNDKALA